MTLSKERLENYASGSWYPDADYVKAMARELLALRERAEPDYIRYDCGCCGWETIEDWRDNDACPKCNHKPMGKTELYTTPPAPVVPDEHHSVIAEQLAHILSVMDVTDHQRAVINCAVDRLNKNAEMLQQSSTTPSSREAILYEPSPTDSANAPLEFTDVEDRAWVVGAEWMRDAFKGENPHLRIANDEDAAPAPVSVPAITFNSASAFEDFWSNFEHPFAEDDELKSFASEIYRAAMLKQPVSTAYKLPDGWVAVPVEPTQEMIDAHVEGVQSGGMQKGYRAMLAAAPAPGKEG
ncbi:hypothetical protein [Cronobacter sakazakii]|uniref:hypothetical protein n=1 Tax=Cronobacter sakazakii TaxID=28141 RepID=UPI001AE70DAE|nr:hypothetical protein [Cronobacter sakazakii]